jgi:hypothetical protein
MRADEILISADPDVGRSSSHPYRAPINQFCTTPDGCLDG